MPELPEVEHLRRTLNPVVIGQWIADLRIHRSDVIRGGDDNPAFPDHDDFGRESRHRRRRALLLGGRIASLHRHGKQLAMVTADGRALCIGLGMTGQLWYIPAGHRLPNRAHVHLTWRLTADAENENRPRPPHARLVFRDARRFGSIRPFASFARLESERWARLGVDALCVSAAELRTAVARTRSPIKAALLDQHRIAGIGNIYADEALFEAGIHPFTPADRLEARQITRLARAIRMVLRQGLHNGGTTLRDYVDANGQPGRNGLTLAVYGREGQPCVRCRAPLHTGRLQGRSTSWCPACQDGSPGGAPGGFSTGYPHSSNSDQPNRRLSALGSSKRSQQAREPSEL